MSSGITVCIATIPPRAKLLRRAFLSVLNQEVHADAIIVEVDIDHAGACSTKNRALAKVTTPWVAWLDDDDYFLPSHLSTLSTTAAANPDIDVIYPWPEMDGSPDPSPQWYGVPFNAAALRVQSYIPTTSLINAKLAQEVGGFQHPPRKYPPYDDHGLYLAMLEAGAQFLHVPKRTWVWNVNGQNTSGDPKRW